MPEYSFLPFPLFWRAVGSFGFPDGPDTEFYDKKFSSDSLPTITTVMDDFAKGKLDLPHWQLALVMLKEVERQISDPQFKRALERVQNIEK